MITTFEQLSQRARQAYQMQHWEGLKELSEEIVKSHPLEAEGYFLKGLYHVVEQQPIKSLKAFEKALSIDPGRYDAAIELANQHLVGKRNSEALVLLEEYEHRLDHSPKYLTLAASVYNDIGMSQQAYPLYQKAYELQPDVALFKSNLAACSIYLGKMKEASRLYKELLREQPNHQRNHYYLSRIEAATDSAHVETMKDSLKHTALPPEKNIFMYYALGKELEDLGQWEEAFGYYKSAGDAATAMSNYNVKDDIDIIEAIIQKCSSSWLAQDKSSATSSSVNQPLFIVGLPRTGTTLTERILTSHSQITSLGETQFLPMVIREKSKVKDLRQVSTEIISGAALASIEDIARSYIENLSYRLSDGPFFIEKLPYNFLYVGFIAKAFPSAKIIYLDRHPMDACFSMYKQVFTWAYKYSYNIENLGEYYIYHRKLLDHWRKIIGENFIEIKYEDLVTHPRESVTNLLTSIELPFEEACLNFHHNQTPSTTASTVQVRQKIHSRSVGKWKSFESQLEPLRVILADSGILI